MFTRSHRLVMIIVYAFEPGAILSNSIVKLEKKNNLFKRKNVIIYMYKYFFQVFTVCIQYLESLTQRHRT